MPVLRFARTGNRSPQEEAIGMDPNATLRQIREIQDRMERRNEAREVAEAAGTMEYPSYDEAQNVDREALTDLYGALDHWVSSGGFLPDEWKSAKTITKAEHTAPYFNRP